MIDYAFEPRHVTKVDNKGNPFTRTEYELIKPDYDDPQLESYSDWGLTIVNTDTLEETHSSNCIVIYKSSFSELIRKVRFFEKCFSNMQ